MLSGNANNLLYLINNNEYVYQSGNFDIDAVTASKNAKIDDYFNELIVEKMIEGYNKEIVYDGFDRPIKIIYNVKR